MYTGTLSPAASRSFHTVYYREMKILFLRNLDRCSLFTFPEHLLSPFLIYFLWIYPGDRSERGETVCLNKEENEKKGRIAETKQTTVN